MQILRNVTGHRPNDGPRPGSYIDKIIQYQEDKINEIPKYGRIFFVVKSPKLLHSRGPNGSRAKSPAPQGPTDRGRPQHLGDHPTGNAVPGCPLPLDALIRTPREGWPYRDPRRERRPRRSLRNKACRDTRPRVSPTLGRVDPDTPGGVSLREITKIAPRREPGGFGVT